MALSLSFFALAMSFFAMGMSYLNKAKNMPQATEANVAEMKKTKNNGMAFLTIGISFISIAIVFAMK